MEGKMNQLKNSYLNLITLIQLENWSVQGLLDKKVTYNKDFTLARIGDFLKKSRYSIDIQNDQFYKRVRVKIRNGGVEERDVEKGINIGTKKQFVASAGQFVVSRIDARNGAFGLIPDSLDGAIVTNDFPLFDVDKTKILPEFLVLITTTKEFINFAQSCSSGTTNRQRMDIDLFLNQLIPLPSIVEQERIINAYNERIKKANKFEYDIKLMESSLEDYIFNELGIPKAIEKKLSKRKGLKFTSFKEINKWGLDFIISRSDEINKYKQLAIKDVCSISSGGTPNRNVKEYYVGGTIPWIKTGELNNEVIFTSEEKITFDALKNSSAKLYKKDSLIIAMYGATIGKTAKLGIDATTNQACAVLFDINNSIINTDFLWEFIQTQTKNLKSLAYGSAQPNLNAGIIANYLIPIPPLSKQNEIVLNSIKLKSQIKVAKELCIQNKNKAVEEFEYEIFGV